MDKYRIVKYGRWLWVIIEPNRKLFLRDSKNNKLLTFKKKDDAIKYCINNNLAIGEEYL